IEDDYDSEYRYVGRPLPALMPLGVLIAGLGMALVGVAPGYAAVFACTVLSGVGVAAFHPESARFANYVSGSRRARGMSLFSVGGNAGFALGPVLTTPLVLLFGLPGTLFLAIPAAAMAAVLLHELPRLQGFRPEEGMPEEGGGEPSATDRWGPFTVMAGVVVLRSLIYFGLVAFVASYYVRVLGTSEAWGNTALAVLTGAGAVGTLVLGPLADRFGRRAVLVCSMLVLGPVLFAFAHAGPVSGMALLALAGAAIVGTFGVTVVMGQEYLPRSIGLAAGVTMGLSIGLGGAGAPVLGYVADLYGLHATMLLISGLPLLALLLALALPEGRRV
ncbi:MAG: MFS transporter, partial [Rubrobacter sp.]|nr:MFS transporter [Rubrobacter sp.]